MKDGLDIITFGCRLNAYESEVMRTHAAAAGLQDAVIINSCAVTGEAVRQVRQTIRKTRRERPTAKIIVTGCAAQIDQDMFAAMPEVDHILGNAEKMKSESYLLETPVLAGDIQQVHEMAGHLLTSFEDKSRAFLQVQNGCDHRCTFCIIPFGRGPSRSVPMDQVIAEARGLVDAGYQELVLTGVDVTSYGGDLPDKPSLGALMRRLLDALPTLPRLRLSSLDAVEMDDDLWHLIAHESRFMPHLHISLQAGDDMVLKRMKRRHLRDDIIAFCARARAARPDITFGADIIAGFPTETDDMFQNTLDLVQDCDLTWLHVFPYSARAGTPAAKMPQVPMPVRKDRAAKLRAAGTAAVYRHLDRQIGKILPVLMETENLGRTPHFAEVMFDSRQPKGQIVMTHITGRRDDKLTGTGP
jgi:threonylcarbamoyladenosine tRNA methylthiotransferase MtaB